MSVPAKRHGWIGLLRIFAMLMVITPHLLAYRLTTLQMQYFEWYVLRPLKIIQFGGAFGVSIFFITSGFLSAGSIGRGKYISRFYKSFVVIFIQVVAASLFCWAFSTVFEKIYSLAGYTSTYEAFTARDWLESSVLYRNYMYQESTEAVFWFLIPFLMCKLIIMLLEIVWRGNARGTIYSVYALFIGLWIAQQFAPDLYLITERFFYIAIILIGYVFGLQQKGKLGKVEFMILQTLNVACMVYGFCVTRVGIDDGYITSALYAALMFSAFLFLGDRIPYSRFIAFFDKIGLSFYLLHNAIGWIIAQGFNFLVFHESYPWASLLIALAVDMIVIILYSRLIANPLDKLLTSFLPSGRHAPKHLKASGAE